jgi:hypothetical protein
MKANKKTIFISAPISLKWDTVCDFDEAISEESIVPVEIKAWDRHTKYDQKDLDESDAVVFLLPKNDFRCAYGDMPIGLRTELARAYAMSKPIFVGYLTRSGEYNIYDAETNGKSIEGVAGTAGSIYQRLLAPEPKKKTLESIEDPEPKKKILETLDDISGSLWTRNPCAEIELPKAKRVYASTVQNPDYLDERLILLL